MKKLILIFLLLPFLGIGQLTETWTDKDTLNYDAALFKFNRGKLNLIKQESYGAPWQNDFRYTATRGDLWDMRESITSNVFHSGDAEGSTVLTLQGSAISNKASITAVDGDYTLVWDASDGLLKKVSMNQLLGGGGGIQIHGVYLNDADANTNGCPLESYYELHQENTLGKAAGDIKKRKH